MARKKQEIQLQREIETQEEWEEVMAMEGLWLIDVYQEWCGPCQALVGNFRRLKNELGDNLLNFAIAKADTIDALEKYRGRCEPTFLFYAGGILTAYIHGANAPKVQRVITEQLAYEHKVLEGTADRKEVKDPVITRLQEIESERLEEEEAKQLALDSDSDARKTPVAAQRLGSGVREEKMVTVAIIKPDAVVQGKAEEIMALIIEQGFEILTKETREITQEEAEALYAHLDNESYYDDIIKFITSGPSVLLVLTLGQSGETAVDFFKMLIGPKEVEAAKEENPNCIRALFGEKGYQNAIHGSDSNEAALRELALLFPNFTVPTYMKKRLNIQKTLAIIKPEVYSKKDDIIAAIKPLNLNITMMKEIHLTKEQAAEFYKEHEQFGFFDALIDLMISGPMIALGLVGDEAITVWRDKLGPDNVDEAIEKAPKSFRARFTGPSGMNQFHGSISEEAAAKEIAFFFPIEQTVAMIKPNGMAHKDEIIEYIIKSGYKIAAQTELVVSTSLMSVLYPNAAGMDHYDEMTNSITSGPSLFMVLSREDAINGWRRDMGDADPAQAKEENPTSLRALYGTDIVNNAVHGSTSAEHAREEMIAVFGEALSFNEDGTLRGDEPKLDETAMVIEGERNEEAEPERENKSEHQEVHHEQSDEHQEDVTPEEEDQPSEKKEEDNAEAISGEEKEVKADDQPEAEEKLEAGETEQEASEVANNEQQNSQDNTPDAANAEEQSVESLKPSEESKEEVQEMSDQTEISEQAEISEQTEHSNQEESPGQPDTSGLPEDSAETETSGQPEISSSVEVSEASKDVESELEPAKDEDSGAGLTEEHPANQDGADPTEEHLANQDGSDPTPSDAQSSDELTEQTQEVTAEEPKADVNETQNTDTPKEPSASDMDVKDSTE